MKSGRPHILLKVGAPRPALNVVPRGNANIDKAEYSGYVTEPIAVAAEIAELARRTTERLSEAIGTAATPESGVVGSSYYPSPGGIDELVVSKFFEVGSASDGKELSAWGNFTSGGKTKFMDAQEILRVAQTGGLPEARTELAAYSLLKKLGIAPDPWIGDEIPVVTGEIGKTASLDELFAPETSLRFEKAGGEGDFLRHVRSKFVEERHEGGTFTTVAENEIDFVVPKKLSTNTVSALPVVRDASGEVFVGVEKRFLPVCEIHRGSAGIVAVPAFRTDKSVDSFAKIEKFLSKTFGVDARDAAPLGESFFPSMGITPEKVYPYSVSGKNVRLPEDVSFVPLRELFSRSEEIRDMQLLVSVFRLAHSTGLWKEFEKPSVPPSDVTEIK